MNPPKKKTTINEKQERKVFFMPDKYTAKRRKNQAFTKIASNYYSPARFTRICECGSYLEFHANKELDKLKLNRANFCSVRFCPMCDWRQSKKDALKVSVLMDYIEREHQKSFIFATFTAPNVKADKLRDELTKFNLAFKNLLKRDELIPVNQGFIRKLEITYNKQRDDYHPHFHCVIAVNKSYFTSRDYVRHSKWLNLWRSVMHDETIESVNVRQVKKMLDDSSLGQGKAVNEIAKYSAKDMEYLHSNDVFKSFRDALHGRQLITYGGLFASANKKFKNNELDHLIPTDPTNYFYLLLYRWGKGDYIEQERRELTPEEIKNANNKLLKESEVD